MIIHLSTGMKFITQKEAKSYFGNHRYRRLVKENKIYFTDYNKPVANDRKRRFIINLTCWKHTYSIVWLYALTATQWFQMSSKRH